jgi:hypothetical protein
MSMDLQETLAELVEQIKSLRHAVETLNDTIQSGNEEQELPCQHPAECVVDLSQMGSGPKWVCVPRRGGCGASEGLSDTELDRLGLRRMH